MSSNHSIGAMNQLADAFDNAGYTPDDVTSLRCGDLTSMLLVVRGQAKIVSADPPKPEPLLEFIGTVIVPAISEKFVAKDHFVFDTSRKAKVKISYLGDNFLKHFLGKVEEPIGEQTLRSQKLRKSSVDGPILAELGGEEKAKNTLAEMFTLIEKQPNGEDGVLLTNGYANIFYIADEAGVVWAVSCRWRGGGWLVRANSIGLPGRWSDGDLVFSRNF